MRQVVLVVMFFLFGGFMRGDTLPQKADLVVDYSIRVRLDPERKQLHGVERLTWRNPSSEAIGELWFHLYLNAFKNTASTFYRESGGQSRGFRITDGRWGWINIRSMRRSDGADLTSCMRFEHPDDDNVADRTVARVLLPQPVPPRGSITLEIDFLAQLPQVFARTGYKRDYFLVGQWFPKIGVYEPAGMRGRLTGGWNCHQFHSMTEFYADYGSYHVEITAPSNYIVGATGIRTGCHLNADRTTTYTYEERDIHDFAWTANPDFLELKATFSAHDDVTATEYDRTARLLGRSLDDVRLSDVDITLLLDPAHRPQAARYFNAARMAIKYFGLWYGRYPYRSLTVVDPAPGAGGSGGMEYPTLITGGTHFLVNHWPLQDVRLPEMVTIHEFGHQFWYGLVGNNEFEEAWLDEGINSYSTGLVLENAYGRDATLMDVLGLRLGEVESIRMQNGPDARFNSILNFGWKYVPHGAYGFYSYTKPEIVLRTLQAYLGEQTMARIMRTFQERWRFRHPHSNDFFAVAREVSGQDLSWLFDAAMRGAGVLDYDVNSISSVPVTEPFGVFDRDGRQVTVSSGQAEQLDNTQTVGKSKQYESVVTIGRRGEIPFPVDIAVKFEDQAPERKHWDGCGHSISYRFVRPERLEWVDVDPDRKIILDVDWLNNSRRLSPNSRVAAKWGAAYLFWFQNLIAFLGF